MKTNRRYISFIALAVVAGGTLLLSPGLVSAKDATDTSHTTTPSTTTTDKSKGTGTSGTTSGSDKSTTGTPTTTDAKKTTTSAKSDDTQEVSGTDRKTIAKEKLDDTKLKACQSRESLVKTTMSSVVTRSQANFDKISAAAQRAEAFYTAKGNVLANYDSLVAAVDTAKVAAQASLSNLTNTAVFSCSSDGPKSEIQTFHNQRLSKIDALSAYRTAVKALITGIKSVQPTETTPSTQTSSTNSSSSPSTTTTGGAR